MTTISAKIIADSLSPTGKRITTFELEYPRFIHAELMTHRVFSRNAASSRAIPVEKAIGLVLENTARPTHWGKNQPGMSAKEECENSVVLTTNVRDTDPSTREFSREDAWDIARGNAISVAKAFSCAGYHKQIVNRLLEPFTHIKVVVTATEFDNWFWLRKHPDAQPEIQQLAERMWEAYGESRPFHLDPGEWHLPYFREGAWTPFIGRTVGVSLEEAIAISSSCCAQVSYRRLDDSLEKALDIYDRLVNSKPVHASPFEHQATPMDADQTAVPYNWQEGVTHMDRQGNLWSGNFKGWIQNRQLIPDNVCKEYRE